MPVTQTNKRQLESLRQRRAEREAHEFNTMTELGKALAKLVCVLKVKAGEDGKMFGAVTAGMIADELKHQFEVSIEKRKIQLEHPIKTLGEYEVTLNLHADVKGTLKIRVESTTPATVVETVPAEAKTEAPRTEKRGRRPERIEAAEGEKPRAAKAQKAAKPAAKPAKPEKE